MLGLYRLPHRTTRPKFAPQWVWSSFEHVRNAPNEKQVALKELHPPYTFFNAGCPRCLSNKTPPSPWDPPASLKFHSSDKSQVVRAAIFPDAVAKEVDDLNQKLPQPCSKAPSGKIICSSRRSGRSNAKSKTDCNGAPTPTYLANTTLETYSQGQVPLPRLRAAWLVMAMQRRGTSRRSLRISRFILEKAQCENDICGPPVTNKSRSQDRAMWPRRPGGAVKVRRRRRP